MERLETISPGDIHAALERLDRAVTDDIPREELVALMRDLVPTYLDPNAVNEAAIREAEGEPA